MTLLIWEPKVETESAMLCWSPMSANTPSNTGRALPSSAGMWMPDWCINARRPTVFMATVLPPVFGPVITNADHPGPMLMLRGTASLPNIGCLARMSLIEDSASSPSSCLRVIGLIAWSLWLYRARASAKSSLAVRSLASCMSSATTPTRDERSRRTRRTSRSSSKTSSRQLLQSSTVAIGSMNSVAPVLEAS